MPIAREPSHRHRSRVFKEDLSISIGSPDRSSKPGSVLALRSPESDPRWLNRERQFRVELDYLVRWCLVNNAAKFTAIREGCVKTAVYRRLDPLHSLFLSVSDSLWPLSLFSFSLILCISDSLSDSGPCRSSFSTTFYKDQIVEQRTINVYERCEKSSALNHW